MVNAFLRNERDEPERHAGLGAPAAPDAGRHPSANLAEHLTVLLGEEVAPEQAADWLADWAALFAVLARIDRRTGGRVGRVGKVDGAKPAAKRTRMKSQGDLARAGRPATLEAE